MKPLLEIKTAIQIGESPSAVFEAIVNPEKMCHYFISSGSGKMEEGKEVQWRFPEFDMEFPIRVGKIVRDQYISYFWEVDKMELQVEISLVPAGSESTLVKISEKGRENDEAGIAWLMGNTEGWANFLACLKAYLEYGINLRTGAFDFLKPQT